MKISVYYRNTLRPTVYRSKEYPVFLDGFVEVEPGTFISSRDIERIIVEKESP